MYQKIVVVGYLGRDPEMRYTPSGVPVTNFSIATTRKWTSQDGTPGEETTWFRVAAWRKLAETCNQYLSKGQLVLVEGRLNPDENGSPRVFQRQDGSYGASYELTARTVRFLGRREPAAPEVEGPAPAIEEEDVPF